MHNVIIIVDELVDNNPFFTILLNIMLYIYTQEWLTYIICAITITFIVVFLYVLLLNKDTADEKREKNKIAPSIGKRVGIEVYVSYSMVSYLCIDKLDKQK